MSRKLVLGAAAVVVIVGGGALAAPYFVGQKVETRFRDQVAALSQRSGVPIKVTAYHRHWFSADATTVAMNDKDGLTLDYDIHHGPWPGFNLATIQTRWTPQDLPITADLDEPLLVVRTRIGLAGNSSTSFHSAPVEGDLASSEGKPTHVVWQGMEGKFTTADQRHLELKAPGLRFKSDDMVGGFKNLHIGGEGTRILGVGSDKPVTVKDLVAQSAINVDQVFIRNPDNKRDYLSFSASMESHAAVPKPDRWGLGAAFKLHQFVLSTQDSSSSALKIDDLTLRITFAGIDANELVGLLNAVRPYQQQILHADKDQRRKLSGRITAILARRLPTLLTDDTSLHFGVPKLDTDHGSAGVSMTASLKPASSQENSALAGSFPGLIQRAMIKASTHIDKPLMQWVLDQGKQPAPYQKMLAKLAEDGLISINDDGLKSSFYMDSDSMRINGQELPDEVRKGLLMAILMAGARQL